jgi:hypothetical protein
MRLIIKEPRTVIPKHCMFVSENWFWNAGFLMKLMTYISLYSQNPSEPTTTETISQIRLVM